MKQLKKITALLVALLMTLTLFTGALAAEEEEADSDTTYPVALGASGYTVDVPLGYYDSGVSEDETDAELVSCYITTDANPDFDVYCVAKTETVTSVADFMTADCADYEGTDLVTEGQTFNDIEVASYTSVETWEDVTYTTMNYAFDAGNSIIELCFYVIPGTDETIPAQIMQTLTKEEPTEIKLGGTGCSITVPYKVETLDFGEDEAVTGLVASYYSDPAVLFIDVYEASSEPITLADAAAAQAEAYGSVTELNEDTINGIPAAAFIGKSVIDGEDYYQVVLLLENEAGSVTDVVFYLDDYANLLQANAAIATLGEWSGVEAVEEEADLSPMPLVLGSSGYRVTLPLSFNEFPSSVETYEETDMTAAYTSGYALFDFEVYEFASSEYESLEAFNEADAAEYNGTEIGTEEINGIPVVSYVTRETSDDVTYVSECYAFAGDNEIVQICFNYTEGTDAAEDVEAVMASLEAVPEQVLNCGSCSITLSADYATEEVETGTDDLTAVHYHSDSSSMCVYVYNWTTDGTLGLEDYVKSDADYAEYEVNYGEINGIPYGYFNTSFTVDTDSEPQVITGVIVAGENGQFTEIDFVTDGMPAGLLASKVLGTLSK